ncbi:heavy metal-associated isoprenylated plant protein 20 [Cryptomeria japonica]|uniref:heavy metal-associated isoprenylated plant protein 20 n=1 Tax=Cryptomeria japonica TaxID=3369 RepID=UPI0027DA35EC|nr:heavy metal-associated isoprenylated plant protein 20 [Cryptomeria japonica]
MGVATDCILLLLGVTSKRRRHRDFLTVEVKVRMDCEGCERKVKNSVSSMKGIKSVEVNRSQNKLTVTGYVDAKKVVKRVSDGTGKRAELWPYVPYNQVYYPYAPQAYDKKAPPGYVRSVEYALLTPNRSSEKYTTLFSDDNPNACTIM